MSDQENEQPELDLSNVGTALLTGATPQLGLRSMTDVNARCLQSDVVTKYKAAAEICNSASLRPAALLCFECSC
jgi:hypothetical protein